MQPSGSVVKLDYGVGKTMVDYNLATEVPESTKLDADMTTKDPVDSKVVKQSRTRNKALSTTGGE